MHDSLLESYKKQTCSYYNIRINATGLFSPCVDYRIKKLRDSELSTHLHNKPYSPQDSCRAFIYEHFKAGGKEEAMVFPLKDKYKDKGKHTHTVSLFLMGLALQNEFSDCIERELKRLIQNVSVWYDFKYTWFLACLYHDTASCIEVSQIEPNASIVQKQLEYYLGNSNIQYTPYSYKPMIEGAQLTRFSEALVKNYFYYRADSQKLDHGIIGGYMLFDRLCKTFYRETCGFDFNETGIKYKNGLCWRREHIDHFAYIADAIICHNIWTSHKKETNELYKKYGLEHLIIKRSNKLNFSEYPLQFMLCLLDTIEPIKRFGSLNAADVLSNISVTANTNGGKLQVMWEPLIEEQPEFTRWCDNLTEMDEWMDLTTSDNRGERNVTIDFR